MQKYVEVTINKPLYGSFVYIRDIYLKKARNWNIPLKITIPSQGTGIMTYDEFMKDAREMHKVFKDPDHPMVLFGNYVKIADDIPKGVVIPKGKSFFDVYEEIPVEEENKPSYKQEELF